MPLEFRETESVPEVPPEIRASYIEAIQTITPHDELEGRDVEKTLEWLRSASALNKPHNMDEHLGVLAVLLSPDRLHTYLLNHKKAQLWLPPGGHVDIGKKLHECAVDETREELGIEEPKLVLETPIFLTRTLTQGKNAGHIDVTSWYVLEADREAIMHIQEKEASESGWVEITALLQTPGLSNLHRGFQKLRSIGL